MTEENARLNSVVAQQSAENAALKAECANF